MSGDLLPLGHNRAEVRRLRRMRRKLVRRDRAAAEAARDRAEEASSRPWGPITLAERAAAARDDDDAAPDEVSRDAHLRDAVRPEPPRPAERADASRARVPGLTLDRAATAHAPGDDGALYTRDRDTAERVEAAERQESASEEAPHRASFQRGTAPPPANFGFLSVPALRRQIFGG